MNIYKNFELLSLNDQYEVKDEIERCFKLKKCKPIHNKFIYEISKRLKSKNGSICATYKREIEIKIAYNVYVQFGLERLLEVLRHEIAHYIAYLKTGKMAHCETFKKICVELGGKMNWMLAGNKYAYATSYDYIYCLL